MVNENFAEFIKASRPHKTPYLGGDNPEHTMGHSSYNGQSNTGQSIGRDEEQINNKN